MRPLTHSITLLVAAVPVAAALLLLQWLHHPDRADGLRDQPLGYAIDLNAADVAALQLLPGVGPGLAEAIVEHRDRLGGFSSVGQLEDVPRVGRLTRQRIEPWVRLGDGPPPR